MARNIKGITVEFDGETKGLDKALSNVNKRSRDLQGELKDVERLLKFNPGNTELIEQKQKLLGDQVENTADKLQKLKGAQKDVERQFKNGDIGEEQYRAFQRELTESESKLSTFEGKLKRSQSKVQNFGDKMKDAGDKVKGVGNKMKDIGGTMSTSVTAPLVGGLFAVTKGTEDTRESLSRLEQNAEDAGVGTDKMKEALSRLSGVTGDTDANVEALSNLLASGFDSDGMTKAMDALSGAVIKFPDTMNIEGLADGLQETLSTGKATGSFAELLERMGINLEDFDEGLQNAAKSGDEQKYALEALADTGLAKVNDKYRENNEELVKSKEGSEDFKQSMAELGETLQPIVTAITEKVKQLVDWFNELSPSGQKIVLIIAAIALAIGPLIVIISMVVTAIGSLITIAGALSIGLAPLIGIILAVVAGVALLVAGFVLAYNKLEWFREMANMTWEFIKESFSNALAFLKALFTGDFEKMKQIAIDQLNLTKEFISNILEKVKDVFFMALDWINQKTDGKFSSTIDAIKKYMDMGLEIIKSIWKFIENSFKNSLDWVSSLLEGDFEGMADAVKNQMGNIWDTIVDIWGSVEDFFGDIDLKEIGREIIQGLIDGINSMGKWVRGAIEDLSGWIPNWIKEKLGIASPSKVTMKLGKYTGEGLEQGITSMVGRIQKASQRMADATVPKMPKLNKNRLASADAGGEFDSPSSQSNRDNAESGNTYNFERMFEGANFSVRDDRDIEELARELFEHFKDMSRGRGV
ncbi:hypothetical protein [Halobacillus sp. A5]|uniref:phage tail protein n=1 Tax=Halobacillus sp. A5 TaxID=2880263 RepID=UPI0020A6D6CA|nr:hypothetical protein [Halobacillus sp. A5]MCP3025418.1 hypothetical protein [Halobacillus sp. A5]